VIPPEVRDGLEVGPESRQQPHELGVAVRLLLQPPAGAKAVEVTVEVKPQQIAGIVPGAAGLRRHRPLDAQRRQVQLRYEGVEEADRIVRRDVIVEDGGQLGRAGCGALS